MTPRVVAPLATLGVLAVMVGGWIWFRWPAAPAARRPPDHWKEVARARAYLSQGRPDLAFQAVSKIQDEAPGSAEALTLAAQALLMRGNVPISRRALERSLKLKPDQADAARMLAAIYLATGDGRRGVTLLQQASRLEPDDFRAWYAMGKVYHDLGDLAKSADAYAQALRRSPPPAEARESRIGRIGVLLEANRHDEAAADLAAARRLWPDEPRVLGLTARHARDLGRTDEAMTLADRALAADPENFDALLVRAQVRHLSGRSAEAQADLEHALRINPNHLGSLQLLLLVQSRLGRLAQAAATKDRFRKTSDRVALMDRLTREIDRRPSDPEPRCQMGQAAVEGGMVTLAFQCFQAALDVDPKYEPAREALAKLRASGNAAPGPRPGPTLTPP
jgi:tetratricopeptide (TPR) repeat protein